MPVPKTVKLVRAPGVPPPTAGESQGDFMSRCQSHPALSSMSPTERESSCSLMWGGSGGGIQPAKTARAAGVPPPTSGEARGDFMARCTSHPALSAMSPTERESSCSLMWGGSGGGIQPAKQMRADQSLTPDDGESQQEFMDRCASHPDVVNMSPDMQQSFCSYAWDDANSGGDGGSDGSMPYGMMSARMERAYARLHVKASETDGVRTIRGIATTPSTDRMGDRILSEGIQYANPMSLLHQHKTDQPVGIVNFDKPTARGITFEATLPDVKEPGPLRDRVETAWGEIKHGLVRGVSIGFRPLTGGYEMMKDNSGILYKSVEVMELSLVTVPANAEATITMIRSLDTETLAASGRVKTPPKAARATPGVTGSTTKPVTLKGVAIMANRTPIADQISAYENTRAAKIARMDDIMDSSAEKGETLDAEQKDEYSTLDIEVKAVDEHLVLLRDREKRAVASAARVPSGDDNDPPVRRSSGVAFNGRISVAPQKVAPGTAFTRYVIAKALSRRDNVPAYEVARSRQTWHDSTPEVEMVLRAGIAPLSSNDANMSALVYYQNMAAEFIEYLRPLTIIGKIPGMRQVPFNIKVPRQTTGSSVGWVGELAPKPVSSLVFDQVTLAHTKVAGIVPLSDEIIRFSSPSAEAIVRTDLAAAIATYVDLAFVDPTASAVTNVNPASVTSGVTPTVATGTTAAALRLDVKTMLNLFLSNLLNPAGGVFIMTQQQALAISMMVNTLGQPEFPGISMEGGTFAGMPVITSENVPSSGGSPADGSRIIFLKANEILLADDGNVNIDVSNEASLQMDSAPDSPATASTTFVSLWQQNMTAIRAEREINWVKRRSTCCQYIDFAKYAE